MEIFVLVVLILINGVFALSEIALVSSKRAKLEHAQSKGSKGAKIALKLLDDSENFLSAIQVGITLIGIVTGMYGGMNIADDITPFFASIESINLYANEIALSLTVVVITYFSIVIGELVPKTIGLSKPEKIAVIVAPLIYYFSRAFYPFVKILSFSTNLINKLLRIKKQNEKITEAEIRLMIRNASQEGVIENEQKSIHEKVFYFSDKKAKHIMTRRKDVKWINIEKPFLEIHHKLSNFQHSKIICSNGNLDNLVGILSLKNYYKELSAKNEIDLLNLITKPIIIHENTDAQDVLSLMKSKNTHICCVVSEFGGFEGIITLHDIIEHIVGEIPEEGEIVEPHLFVRDDGSVLVNGNAPVEILSEVVSNFDVDFENNDYSTVAGFAINQIGKIPTLGEKFEYLGYRFEIVDMDKSIVDKVLIERVRILD